KSRPQNRQAYRFPVAALAQQLPQQGAEDVIGRPSLDRMRCRLDRRIAATVGRLPQRLKQSGFARAWIAFQNDESAVSATEPLRQFGILGVSSDERLLPRGQGRRRRERLR